MDKDNLQATILAPVEANEAEAVRMVVAKAWQLVLTLEGELPYVVVGLSNSQCSLRQKALLLDRAMISKDVVVLLATVGALLETSMATGEINPPKDNNKMLKLPSVAFKDNRVAFNQVTATAHR